LPRSAPKGITLEGIALEKLTADQEKSLQARLDAACKNYNSTRFHSVTVPKQCGVLRGVSIPADVLQLVLLLGSPTKAGSPGTFTIVQKLAGIARSGGTFVLRALKV
jgi:hypothetical protein